MSRSHPVLTVALYPCPNVEVRPPSVLRDVVWLVSLSVLGGLLVYIITVLLMMLW